ncbi:cobyric acid synthase [Methanoplanus endosymbiosus]|uniref:Probable cobyric acid synthase n=1 Tax=Methanoplanus endosymbiosus TaxID=33865 RepID=A0A9E7PPS3_9EURY|nr:cobyric acid synthase [Methanoplanus endosymbiosus]UUX92786.1 cobyric acid synthase [Methanoplanus endosymbiosus]
MSLMILGTSSHAGKSTVVAAICRSLKNSGIVNSPFKSQNMSLNSYITTEGDEIGIAQAMQAFAAGISPQKEMNPVLLKPKGDKTSQIVLLGKPFRDVYIGDYYMEFEELLKISLDSFYSLEEKYGTVIVEGAGGAAEINLYKRDIANIQLAKKLQIPIIIVGDIERGGIFAQIIGTYNLLPADVVHNVAGFIINKFRGDPELFTEGVREIEKRTGKPVLGVIPYTDINIPSEDSLSIQDKTAKDKPIKTAIIRLPRISNFSDFEILENYSAVEYVHPEEIPKDYDLIIIPGTKNTTEDLKYLRENGFFEKLREARDKKIPIIGICGGYQMLGKTITDMSVESDSDEIHEGIGILNTRTRFEGYRKTTVQVSRRSNPVGPILSSAGDVTGYEIHMGVTLSDGIQSAFEDEGAVTDDGLVIGTYMHGLFSNMDFSQSLLKYLHEKRGITFSGIDESHFSLEKSFSDLASHFEKNADLELIRKIAVNSQKSGR